FRSRTAGRAHSIRRGLGSIGDDQQYIIQRTIPISIVAAMIPKVSAARNTVLPLLSMAIAARSLARAISFAVVVVFAAACVEATAPARRYAVLDDVGQSNWQSVSVGGDHSCALKTDGSAHCWGSNRYFQLGVPASDTLCGPEKARYACNMAPKAVQVG